MTGLSCVSGNKMDDVDELGKKGGGSDELGKKGGGSDELGKKGGGSDELGKKGGGGDELGKRDEVLETFGMLETSKSNIGDSVPSISDSSKNSGNRL